MKFSEAFKMDQKQASLDFIDIPLDTDLRFFIDPTSIRSLKTAWGDNIEELIRDYFSDILACVKNSNLKRAGVLLSSLKESNAFHLGYSVKKSSGKALGEKTAELILESLKNSKAAQTGLLKDLEDTALTIPGIASDRISDSVCNILKIPFIEYTQNICKFYNIDMVEVSGIRLWDSTSGKWVKRKIQLPVYNDEEIILIPKVLAREKIAYSHTSLYRKYIIPEMKVEHLHLGTALVKVLRGKPTVTATRIIKEYGQSKEFIESQLVKYPAAIEQYREELLLSPLLPLPHSRFDTSKDAVTGPLSLYISQLKLSLQKKDNELYVDSLKKIFLTIFYPSLFYPCVIRDIVSDYSFTMLNESRDGFFFDFSIFEILSEKILINIVMLSDFIDANYLTKIINDMNEVNTSVCFLVCCEISNNALKQELKEIAKNEGKYIFILNDATIDLILREYLQIGDQQFNTLRGKFKEF
ncbi:hypothetical protein [Serratia fonticola]|uniref:hypothetical protein n=1 Tax=Serratia fonticola TaxID=47917 RepID=UPI00093B2A3F|nr:hypothetical protein [Serratia fonticola]OKP29018.1 hypothetical protein BSQ40_10085 [Serratia fonticola]